MKIESDGIIVKLHLDYDIDFPIKIYKSKSKQKTVNYRGLVLNKWSGEKIKNLFFFK